MTASPCNGPISVQWREDATAQIMALLTDRPTAPNTLGTPFVQSNFSTLKYTVYDISETGDESVIASLEDVSLTIASVVFDSLQGWSIDTTGHNFRAVIPRTAFPAGVKRVRVVVEMVMTDGRVGQVAWDGPVQPISTK